MINNQKKIDDAKMLQDIFKYIKENQIFSFLEFLNICSVDNFDWFIFSKSSKKFIIDKYIKSLNWEKNSGYVRQNNNVNID